MCRLRARSAGVSQCDTYFQLSRLGGPCAALSGSVDVCIAPRHICSAESRSMCRTTGSPGGCVAVRHIFLAESTPVCRTLRPRAASTCVSHRGTYAQRSRGPCVALRARSAGVSQCGTYFQLSRRPRAALSGSVVVCVASRHICSAESRPMCRTTGCVALSAFLGESASYLLVESLHCDTYTHRHLQLRKSLSKYRTATHLEVDFGVLMDGFFSHQEVAARQRSVKSLGVCRRCLLVSAALRHTSASPVLLHNFRMLETPSPRYQLDEGY